MSWRAFDSDSAVRAVSELEKNAERSKQKNSSSPSRRTSPVTRKLLLPKFHPEATLASAKLDRACAASTQP
jgi:hypothetical protein